MTYSFLELLIFFGIYLQFGFEVIPHYIKEILHVNTNYKGNQS